jgi:hypothetical protein
MNNSKLKEISTVLRIFKNLDKKDLDFFILNTSNRSIQLILEIVYNLITNEGLVSRIGDRKLLKNVRTSMLGNKKKWCSVIKSKNEKTKLKFVRNQIGSGVIVSICSLVLPIIIGLIAKK